MKLEHQTFLEEFRQEMQHRVVRYPLNSRPVKEALRFAKRHSDPAFYRIASDKIHAQRQFQRELYGPSRLERLVDFFALGSLREVVVTLVLVAGGVVGLDVAKRAMQDPDEEIYANMNVDALADRLGIVLESSRLSAADPAVNGEVSDTPAAKRNDQSSTGLSEADVSRIAEAVIQRLSAPQSNEPNEANQSVTATANQAQSQQTTATVDDTEIESASDLAVPAEDRKVVGEANETQTLAAVSDESSRQPN